MINNAPTPMLLAWNTVLIVILIVLAVLLTVFIVLSIIGRKMQKKQADNEAAMKQSAQVMSMLIIDKKRMKLNEAGLPSIVMEQTPKYMRRAKLPIAKVRVGPKNDESYMRRKDFSASSDKERSKSSGKRNIHYGH